MRDLIETSVTTTVAAGGAAGAPPSWCARLTDAAGGRPRVRSPSCRRWTTPPCSAGSTTRSPASAARSPRRWSSAADGGGVVAEVTLGLAYEGPPGYVHGGMSALLMDQLLGCGRDGRRAVGHDRPPRAGLPRAAAAGARRCVLRAGSPRTPAARRSSPARSPLADGPRPGRWSRPAGVFVAPRAGEEPRPTSGRSPTPPGGTRRPAAPPTPPPSTGDWPAAHDRRGLTSAIRRRGACAATRVCPTPRRPRAPARGRTAVHDVEVAGGRQAAADVCGAARRGAHRPASGTPVTPPPSGRSSPC